MNRRNLLWLAGAGAAVAVVLGLAANGSNRSAAQDVCLQYDSPEAISGVPAAIPQTSPTLVSTINGSRMRTKRTSAALGPTSLRPNAEAIPS